MPLILSPGHLRVEQCVRWKHWQLEPIQLLPLDEGGAVVSISRINV